MAVSANQPLLGAMNPGKRRTGEVHDSIHLYEGTLCFYERSSGADEGFITDTDDGGSNNFAGVVKKEQDNSSGSSGDLDVEFYTEGGFVLAMAAANKGYVGDKAYATDNYVVTASSSSSTWIGKFTEYIDATHMRVDLFQSEADPT